MGKGRVSKPYKHTAESLQTVLDALDQIKDVISRASSAIGGKEILVPFGTENAKTSLKYLRRFAKYVEDAVEKTDLEIGSPVKASKKKTG